MDFLKYEKLVSANAHKMREAAETIETMPNPPHREWASVLYPFIVSGLTIKDLLSVMSVENKNITELDLMAKAAKFDLITGGSNRLCDDFLKDLDYSLSNGLSMVFFGFNGAGKTYTAKYLLFKVIQKDRTGYHINSAELQRLYNQVNFSGEADLNLKCVLDHVMNCDLLVIDEVGKESLTDNFLVAFESILKGRASRDKSTIMVTNLNFDNEGKNEFATRYGSSIYNMLYEHYRVILFSSKGEFRKKQRKVWK